MFMSYFESNIRAGRCRERLYADHIYSHVLQNAPFRSQIFFASGSKGVLTPLTKILRTFLPVLITFPRISAVSAYGNVIVHVFRSVS